MRKFIKLIFLTLLFVSCGKKTDVSQRINPHQDAINLSSNFFNSNKKLYPAKTKSKYFTAIKKCALQIKGKDCSPEKTPLLGMIKPSSKITIDDVLNYTVVSHKFLIKNFKEALKLIDNKIILTMFSSVSGIIITDEISSSFYNSDNGVIYLNASYLWKNSDEKNQLKFKKDPRASLDKRKKIKLYINYVKNEEFLLKSQSDVQKIDNLAKGLERLLFHELTHAMDFFPEKDFFNLDQQLTYSELADKNFSSKKLISDQIRDANDTTVWGYAKFYFYNKIMVSWDNTIFSMTDFLNRFVPDNGVSLYSYTSKREHLAMLMEQYLLLNVEDTQTCTAGIFMGVGEKPNKLFWFQKNRVLQPNILIEAQEAIRLLFPKNISSIILNKKIKFKMKMTENVSSFYEACISQ